MSSETPTPRPGRGPERFAASVADPGAPVDDDPLAELSREVARVEARNPPPAPSNVSAVRTLQVPAPISAIDDAAPGPVSFRPASPPPDRTGRRADR